MSNPVLAKNPHFQPGQRPEEYRTRYDNQMTLPETGLMTVENTMQKTVLTFAILIAAAAVGWFFPILALPALVGALVVGIIQAVKKEPNLGLIVGYAVLEGLVVGGVSSFFEQEFPGIVSQAVIATFIVVGVTLMLFVNKKVRATPKLTRFFFIATLSYLVFSLVNLGLVMTGAIPNMFGAREIEFMGIPLGIIIGIFAVLLATYSLILDFTYIQNGVANKLPAKYGWMGAFGIMVTVVWLYLEILRIIALTRR